MVREDQAVPVVQAVQAVLEDLQEAEDQHRILEILGEANSLLLWNSGCTWIEK